MTTSVLGLAGLAVSLAWPPRRPSVDAASLAAAGLTAPFATCAVWLTNSEWALRLLQAIMSLAAVAAAVWVGGRVIGLTAGLVAGLVVALDPLLLVASGRR